MKNLDFLRLQDFDKLVFPDDFSDLSLDSPALSFVSDFKSHHPSLLTPSVSALDAAQVMRAGHLSAVLVLDSEGVFTGLLTSEDISYQRVMQCVAAGVARQELTVGDLMRPRSELKMLSYQQVEKSTIREVLEAMRRSGQRECLVVDLHNHHVRGLISASEVGTRLHAEINIDTAPSFAELLRTMTPVH
ncbi:CBS domain-containing protein [Microbulbifer hainanensis]|uniref:CBS domain-containing protein n=1 Tax=Microbulbifer hainanensis TaxID=2735675 RepID=UPI001866CDD6|nr:CBS domain-containing protein [Microbulbifer hainanensis]